MARYDEDLHDNLFFQTLVNKFSHLFNEAAENRWMVFVPRTDTVSRLKLSKTDFDNHIVKSAENGEEGTFVSLNGKSVVVDGDNVSAGQGYKETRTVKILFEECFFNSQEKSYQVFCLDQPLEGALGEDVVVSLENLEDCIKYLWSEAGCERVRKSVDKLLDIFSIERDASMRLIMDASSAVYNRAVQEVYKLRKFQVVAQRNFSKLAIETYVLAGLHKKIFKEVCFKVASKDAVLNKITRNLSDVNPQCLGIKPQLRLCIPKSRAVLSQLNQFATPLEKLYCFKKCVSALVELPLDHDTYEVMTADELLPILVYLVIVCDIPNWTGNLSYITKFHFSQVATEEFSYYMTSFEAAVEYIRSESREIANMSSGISKAAVERLRSNSNVQEEEPSFFVYVSRGDIGGVRRLLQREKDEADSLNDRLCHPLCDCEHCTKLLDKQLDDSDRASVFSRDENGMTGLHHSARLGHADLSSLLIEHGAMVTSTDHHASTPLHLACQKGHQKCTLLLLGEGSSVNTTDNHGNTPLHLACSNGHEECVKALVFNKEKCDVNKINDQGDSPLHNAARWGYATIVSVLLTHGASTNTLNRRRESAQQCSQSGKVQELLSDARKRHSIAVMDEEENDSIESPPLLRTKQVSRRMSMRDSFSEPDRQLKKMFRAVQDGDTNLVMYLFGWDEGQSSTRDKDCHPLCQCDKCSRLRKSPPVAPLSVNCRNSQGLTPLHKAALQGHTKMVDLLLRHGAQSDVRTRETQQTPMHLACQYNNKDVVMVLLENGAHVTPQDHQGNTPLHLACTNGHQEAAMLMLIHGADVTISNNRGDTSLHNAARWNHPGLVNELMLYGAQYKATNNEGKTPLDLTKDDDVQLLIVKAISGQLAVGSYTPIRPAAAPTSRSDKRPNKLTNHVHTKKLQTVVEPSPSPVIIGTADLFPVDPGDQPDHTLFTDGRDQPDHTLYTDGRGQPDHTLFPVENEDALFSPVEKEVGNPPMMTKENERIRELLRAIESYDRASTLRRTSTIDRSVPILHSSPPPSASIEVPTCPKATTPPGGSWDCVQVSDFTTD